MEIREAALATADLIEANPGRFYFNSIEVPTDKFCGSPGCALGWISFFRGTGDNWGIETIGVTESEFYVRMDLIDGIPEHLPRNNWGPWTKSAAHCAKNLRIYADLYLPERVMNYVQVAVAFDDGELLQLDAVCQETNQSREAVLKKIFKNEVQRYIRIATALDSLKSYGQ